MACRIPRRGFLASAAAATTGATGCLHTDPDDTEHYDRDGESEEDPEVQERRRMLEDAERPGDSENWLTWGYDNQNTGYNPYTTGPKDEVERNWTYEADGKIRSQPVVVDDTVYFGSEDGRIHAVHRDTGEQKFTYDTEGVIHGSPTVAGDHLLAGDRDSHEQTDEAGRNFYAIDRATGEEKWRLENLGRIEKTPVFHGQYAITPSRAGLKKIDLAERKATKLDGVTSTTPAIHENTSISTGRTEIYGYNLETENESWRWEIPHRTHIFNSPTVSIQRDRVYIAGPIQALHCVSTNTQEEIWQFSPEERDVTVDRQTPPPTGTTSPCIHPDLVVTADTPGVWGEPGLYAIDHDGEELWRNQTTGHHGAENPPSQHEHKLTCTQDTVYTTNREGTLHALDIHNGETRWSHQLDGETTTSPTITHNRIYIADDTGTIYALE